MTTSTNSSSSSELFIDSLNELTNNTIFQQALSLKEGGRLLREERDQLDLAKLQEVLAATRDSLIKGEIFKTHIAKTPYEEMLKVWNINTGTLVEIIDSLEDKEKRKFLTHALFVSINNNREALRSELAEIAKKIIKEKTKKASPDNYEEAVNNLTNLLILLFADISNKLRDGIVQHSGFFDRHTTDRQRPIKTPKDTRKIIREIQEKTTYSKKLLSRGSELEDSDYEPLLEFAIRANFIGRGLSDEQYIDFLNNAELAFLGAKELYEILEKGLAEDTSNKKVIRIDLNNEITNNLWGCIIACFCSNNPRVQHHAQTLFMLTLIAYEGILSPTFIKQKNTTEKSRTKSKVTSAILDTITSEADTPVTLYSDKKTGKISLNSNDLAEYTSEEELNCRKVRISNEEDLLLYVPDDLFSGHDKEKRLSALLQKMTNQGLSPEQISDQYRSQIIVVGVQKPDGSREAMTNKRLQEADIKNYIYNFFTEIAEKLALEENKTSRSQDLAPYEFQKKDGIRKGNGNNGGGNRNKKESPITDIKMYFTISAAENKQLQLKRKILKDLSEKDEKTNMDRQMINAFRKDVEKIYKKLLMRFELRFVPLESYGIDKSDTPYGHGKYALERLYEMALLFIRSSIEPEIFRNLMEARKEIERARNEYDQAAN